MIKSEEKISKQAAVARRGPLVGLPDYSDTIHTDLDRFVRSSIMRFTLGRSPISLINATTDWLGHLLVSPGLQQQLFGLAVEQAIQLWLSAIDSQSFDKNDPNCIGPTQDKRFLEAEWSTWPFNYIHKSFLGMQDWWQIATTAVPGVSRHNAGELGFLVRQTLDQLSPGNFLITNPVALAKTLNTGGINLWNGALNVLDDLQRLIENRPPAGSEDFIVGKTVACTSGTVVYRNELIELIQYAPLTKTVYSEPILIVPAWIMKYYILDLSPNNSLVKYLVEAGYTVFMVSWRNPRPEDSAFGMDDYLSLGVNEALQAITTIVPGEKIHAVGYCLGGTLVSIGAAALGRRAEHSLKTLTLLAAQTDFADAGELTLFIDESEVTLLEDLMSTRGYLDARQMAGAFHMLRSNDLIWSRLIHDYLLGERRPVTDFMAWSADATHMPYRMHSEYLRRLFLNNDLASGRYFVGDRPVGISNIDAPMFVVATERDHIAPWKSVYKIHLQADVDITFVLTTGGHNVGIINPPGSSNRQYRIGLHRQTAAYVSPERWIETHEPIRGSWWPAWRDWLIENSSVRAAIPQMGAPDRGYSLMNEAPGTYVFDCEINEQSNVPGEKWSKEENMSDLNMKKTIKSAKTPFTTQVTDSNNMASENAQRFWDYQNKMLDSMQCFANGWFERRHVGTHATLEAAQRIYRAETPVDALREYQDWVSGAFQRVMADGLALQQQVAAVFELPEQEDETKRPE